MCFIIDLSYVNHSKLPGRSTSLTGLPCQYTGYSINLAGGRITLLAMAFPFNLIEVTVCLVYSAFNTSCPVEIKQLAQQREREVTPGYEAMNHAAVRMHERGSFGSLCEYKMCIIKLPRLTSSYFTQILNENIAVNSL